MTPAALPERDWCAVRSLPHLSKNRATPELVEYVDRRNYVRMPVLTLRPWDYGNGLDPHTEGLGFRTPDGRTWAAHSCLWALWHELGVLVVPAVGTRHHLDDLSHPSFVPGCPIRLMPEPENPHDPMAIAVRNWTTDKTAGYVKRGNASRLRNLVRGQDIRIMALSCRYDELEPQRRVTLKVVVFRSERLVGADHIPAHPALD